MTIIIVKVSIIPLWLYQVIPAFNETLYDFKLGSRLDSIVEPIILLTTTSLLHLTDGGRRLSE